MENKIDSFEAYVIMCDFLDKLYFKSKQNDLGVLLGDIAINPNDGLPTDLGMKSIWKEVFSNMFHDDKIKVNSEQAFLLMIRFLNSINKNLKSYEISELTSLLELNGNSFLEEWVDSIEKMLLKYRMSNL